MNKVVTLPAFKGLQNVSIDKFNLPSSDPLKGINVEAATTLDNPSVTTIELGDIEFDQYYKNASIGSFSSTNVTLVPGPNHLNLKGHIIAINTSNTEALSNMFTLFLGGTGTPLEVVGKSVVPPLGPVSWLSAGFVGNAMVCKSDELL
jgi:hypothetical protein